jgi:hypothetical protein
METAGTVLPMFFTKKGTMKEPKKLFKWLSIMYIVA